MEPQREVGMKIENLNQWLGVLANFGVLVGVIFLTLEISQTNRIAERDSRESNLDSSMEINLTLLQDQNLMELMTKLSSPSENLSSLEEEQARTLAGVYLSHWGKLGVQTSTQLIPDRNVQASLNIIADRIDRTPGLKPYLIERLNALGVKPDSEILVYSFIWGEVLE
jgi:hypothetical protein